MSVSITIDGTRKYSVTVEASAPTVAEAVAQAKGELGSLDDALGKFGAALTALDDKRDSNKVKATVDLATGRRRRS
jgi:hypothetical protein